MQSSKEQQGEIRKPSSVINTKNQRKTIEQERLEISSRKFSRINSQKFKKYLKKRDIKGTFHAKMGSIKDRNGMDLTEAEDIKKMWQEYTEELCKTNTIM